MNEATEMAPRICKVSGLKRTLNGANLQGAFHVLYEVAFWALVWVRCVIYRINTK